MEEHIYIDSWVLNAYLTVFGGHPSEEMEVRMGKLSQIHRSSDAGSLFERISGFSVKSREALQKIMEKLREDEAFFDSNFEHQVLKSYTERKGSHAFD